MKDVKISKAEMSVLGTCLALDAKKQLCNNGGFAFCVRTENQVNAMAIFLNVNTLGRTKAAKGGCGLYSLP